MDDLKALYDALAAAKARKQVDGSAGDTALEDDNQNRANDARAMQETRARPLGYTGSPKPTTAAIRAALADAALIVIAAGADGAPELLRLVGKAFPDRPGVPGTVMIKARAGKLRPKVLTLDRLRNR